MRVDLVKDRISDLFCWLPNRNRKRQTMATGRRNLPPSGPVILMANQEEALDLGRLERFVGRPTHLLVGPHPPGRWNRRLKNGDLSSVRFSPGSLAGWRSTLDVLRRGEAVVASPLGWDGQSDLAAEAGLLSRLAGAPIVPVFILVDCCHLPFSGGSDLPPPDEIMTFGPPLTTAAAGGREQLTRALQDWFLTIDTTAHNRWPSPTATSWT